MTALTLSPDDIFNEKKEVARYVYPDAYGEILGRKIRYSDKSFEWSPKLNGTKMPLYNLPRVLQAVRDGETVWIVEGEKDADRLSQEGVAATTNPNGASEWSSDYGAHLVGADVVVVADRDEPGVRHALRVAEDLKGRALSVRVVQSATTGKGHDISDHLDAGHSLDAVVPYRKSEMTRKYQPVNWRMAFKEQSHEIEWLKEDFLEAGTLVSMFSKPGIGKSLISLEIAVEAVRAGHNVMYIDDENRISDTVDRLKAFRCSADELDRLTMYCFAGLPALDTEEGGQHLDALAEENEPKLVIMDTVSRMVSGEENAANTFLQLYRCSLVPLKARGIAILRLDHAGKDDLRGMRGSSAKESDVDFVWKLSRDGERTFTLECQKSRNGHIAFGQIIQLERLYDPLRHVWDVKVEIPLSQYEGIMRLMDKLGVPESYGRDRVRGILRDHNISGMRNDALQAAIVERRNRRRKAFVPPPGTDGD